MTSVLAVVGALAGSGVLLVVMGLYGRRRSLAELVSRYELAHLPSPAPGEEPQPRRPLLQRAGRTIDTLACRIGRPLVRDEDLAVLERDAATQFAGIGLAAAGLGAGAALTVAAAGAIGIHPPPEAAPVGIVAGGLLGAALVTIDLRRAAQREREALVRALGCWLELVALAQAGGMGVESALQVSSLVSDDPCFVRLRGVLAQAQVSATTPWEGLAALGSRIGVRQLEELAATLELAGTEGARVRTTLTAKAASLRQHQMAAAQAEAREVTERLFLPSIILMMAFMVFLMYPAAVRLAHVF
jgi:tight adherence protein C